MSSKLTPTALPTPPNKYDIGYMDRLTKQIGLEFTRQKAITPITCASDLTEEAGYPISGMTIINVPTDPDVIANLPDWSVWCDTSAGNVLKIKLPTP
jgi:hypothetical protein